MARARKVHTTESVAENSKSDALKQFEVNLDAIMAFLARLRPIEIRDSVKALERVIKRETALLPQVNVKRLERGAKKFQAEVDKWIAFHRPAIQSMSVMLVYFIEEYLEHGLAILGKKNPLFMKTVEFECHRAFEVNSIDELRNELLLRWAHDALRPGGPETWFKQLRNMGARPIDQDVVRNLQHLWDTRNLIVHSRCIASVAYAKKYAYLAITAGTIVPVNLDQFGRWLEPVKQFTEWADAFFLGFLSSKEKIENT